MAGSGRAPREGGQTETRKGSAERRLQVGASALALLLMGWGLNGLVRIARHDADVGMASAEAVRYAPAPARGSAAAEAPEADGGGPVERMTALEPHPHDPPPAEYREVVRPRGRFGPTSRLRSP